VEIGGKRVLLWKSNTHLDFPGQTELSAMMQMLIREVKPGLVLSIGTAGGAMVGDHVGTVRAVSAGTLYEKGKSEGIWPEYANAWSAAGTVLHQAGFASLLFPVPTTEEDLAGLVTQFNSTYGSSYSIFDLDPDGLNNADTQPKFFDETGGGTSLLTTPTFVVGTTAGTYGTYALRLDLCGMCRTRCRMRRCRRRCRGVGGALYMTLMGFTQASMERWRRGLR
jgi:hypothetical protein